MFHSKETLKMTPAFTRLTFRDIGSLFYTWETHFFAILKVICLFLHCNSCKQIVSWQEKPSLCITFEAENPRDFVLGNGIYFLEELCVLRKMRLNLKKYLMHLSIFNLQKIAKNKKNFINFLKNIILQCITITLPEYLNSRSKWNLHKSHSSMINYKQPVFPYMGVCMCVTVRLNDAALLSTAEPAADWKCFCSSLIENPRKKNSAQIKTFLRQTEANGQSGKNTLKIFLLYFWWY